MKKVIALAVVAWSLAGCSVNKQIDMVKALGECRYDILSADSVYIANTNVSKLVADGKVDMARVPGLAIALLRKNVPLSARINLNITNPTADLAGINQFEYKVLVKNHELANGFVNQKVEVQPGGTTAVPVRLNANIYEVLQDGKTLDDISDFLSGGKDSKTEKKGVITLKIRPTLDMAGRAMKYPGYITIDKEISSKILF
jgi:hypothetical protein